VEDNVVKKAHLAALLAAVLLTGLSGTALADIKLVDTDVNKLSLYGWIKGDATYQDDDMNDKVAPRFAVSDGDNGTNLTAMHSRFGLKWGGPALDNGWKADAVFEFDLFDGGSQNQMKLRNRLAAFTLSKDRHSVLVGQHWDIFSPLGPTTLMTNGYLWQTGNLGFRRAQARYTYKGDFFEYAGSINDPSMSGESAETDSPIFEGRVGFTLANVKLLRRPRGIHPGQRKTRRLRCFRTGRRVPAQRRRRYLGNQWRCRLADQRQLRSEGRNRDRREHVRVPEPFEGQHGDCGRGRGRVRLG
jgi:hypothetical protein